MTTIQIVSPHLDDAFLSLGGSISNWVAASKRVRVINVFSRSGWTNRGGVTAIRYFWELERVSTMRRAEEHAVADEAGHEVEFLDHLDEMSRGRKAKVVGLLSRGILPQTQTRLRARVVADLADRIEIGNTVMFPLGVGSFKNPDHVLLADLGWEFSAKGYNVEFYEDLPYASQVDDLSESFPSGVLVAPIDEPIDLDRKMNILQNYSSQLSDRWLSDVSGYANRLGGSSPVERRWRVVTPAPQSASAASTRSSSSIR